MRAVALISAVVGLIFVSNVRCQNEDDGSYHFSDRAGGRAAWVVDESSLPWVGSFDYISSDISHNTVLMTVVDSSTGTPLGECSAVNTDVDDWETFVWTLTADSLQCNVSETNSSRVRFPLTSHTRTFSVRIQSVKGPRCVRDLTVQNEKPVGCPPHLRRNAFTAHALACGCPHADSDSRGDTESPEFPIFELGGSQAPPTQETPAWTVSPCANVVCQNNGTCVVGADGAASCLCQNGFSGSRCQVDVCAAVPCAHGGVCRASGGTAVCECPPHTKGILCEQIVCDPVCAQGECNLIEGAPMCECKQGFIGPNCNVVDVCIGDAACAVFGEHAKCTLEDSAFTTVSARLVNATYDCHCPHPQTGQWMDCMSLVLSSSTIATGLSMVQPQPAHTTPPPMLPFQPFSPQTTQSTMSFLPTAFQTTPSSQPIATQQPITAEIPIIVPVLPAVTQTTTQPPLVPVQTEPTTAQASTTGDSFPVPATNIPFGIHSTTGSPSEETSEEESMESTVSSVVLPSSLAPPVQQPAEVPVQQTTFPIPGPMDISQQTTPHAFGRLGVVEQTTQPQQQETTTMEESSEEETTSFGTGQESTEIPFIPMLNFTTEASVEDTTTSNVPETQPPVWPQPTEQQPDMWKPHPVVEATTGAESSEETTELPVHPLWGVTTESAPSPQPTDVQTTESQQIESEEEMETETPSIFTQPSTPEEEEKGEEDEEEEQPVRPEPPVTQPPTTPPTEPTTTTEEVEDTTKQSVAGGAVGQGGSSAASWIIALIAIVALGMLLLASTLFIFRYFKQSRKLHGKYNPAREEHALSAAYSLPMTHVTKEERLI